jgi:hypothetical protein
MAIPEACANLKRASDVEDKHSASQKRSTRKELVKGRTRKSSRKKKEQ